MAAPFQWSLAALETLMAEDQMDQHAAVLRAFSVVELWRLRRVCRAFHRWGTAALAALPRVVVVGGNDANRQRTARVEVLDLSLNQLSAFDANAFAASPPDRSTTVTRVGSSSSKLSAKIGPSANATGAVGPAAFSRKAPSCCAVGSASGGGHFGDGDRSVGGLRSVCTAFAVASSAMIIVSSP